MEEQTIQIKGMVCKRCIMAVETELQAMGHIPTRSSLGEISFVPRGHNDGEALERRLNGLGLTLLVDKKKTMVNEVKQLVEEVYSGNYDFPQRFRFSELASRRLQRDYEAISDAFISAEGKTIEQYIILQRINKVKEYLVYSSHTLADIAFRLNFSSVAHLSAQFKQHTGLTPSYFKTVRQNKNGLAFSNN